MDNPWVLHGETTANLYGQNPMENSWISLMKFSWDISVRVLRDGKGKDEEDGQILDAACCRCHHDTVITDAALRRHFSDVESSVIFVSAGEVKPILFNVFGLALFRVTR